MDAGNVPHQMGAPVRRTAVARISHRIERPLIYVLERIAAVLVLADVVILLLGVIARYVFQHPLIWTDDLAQAVFLWLGMIGSVVALNRGEHMRMTAILARANRPQPRAGMEAYGSAVGLLFLAAVVQPAIEYVDEVSRLLMPGMGGIEGVADSAVAGRVRADDRHRRNPAVPHLSNLGRGYF